MTPNVISHKSRSTRETALSMDSGSLLDVIMEGWTCAMLQNSVYQSVYDFATGRGMSLSEVVELAMQSLSGHVDKVLTQRERDTELRNQNRKNIISKGERILIRMSDNNNNEEDFENHYLIKSIESNKTRVVSEKFLGACNQNLFTGAKRALFHDKNGESVLEEVGEIIDLKPRR